MAGEPGTNKCVVCGGNTADGMVVCYHCFFNYDHQTYNRKDLEKKSPKKKHRHEDWNPRPAAVAAPQQTPQTQHTPRVLNQTPLESFDMIEQAETAPAPQPAAPQATAPRELPTLANRMSASVKKPKTLFSSFSWLLDRT